MSSHEEPEAQATDAFAKEGPRERPAQVVLAVKLAIIGAIVGALAASLSWKHYSPMAGGARGVVVLTFTLLFMAWIYYKIYVGANWARILYLVLALVGPLIYVSGTSRTLLLDGPILAKASSVINTAITIAILWLLFTRPGSAWFSRQGRAPAA